MKLRLTGKEVLINKVFDLTHKEKIKETRKAITPIVDTVKLCGSKYDIERSQGQRQNDPQMGKSDLTDKKSCRSITA